MSLLESIALGAIQGLTEFLPISSSGHLALAKHLWGIEVPILYDVLLHVATLFVVFIVFRKRIGAILLAFFRLVGRKDLAIEDKEQLSVLLKLVGATAITVVLALGIRQLEEYITIAVVGVCFIVTGLVLLLSKLVSVTTSDTITWKAAIAAGFAQGIGVLPGISRSGSTISSALLAGMDRNRASEFSFILSIPAILGALILTAREAASLGNQIGLGIIIAGVISSFLVGLVAILFLIRLVKKGQLFWFAIYLIPLGILCFFL